MRKCFNILNKTVVAFIVFFFIFIGAAQASSVYYGITDTGKRGDFNREAKRMNYHFPLLQTFHPWGNKLNQAIPRWNDLQVRPVLHISTADDETQRTLITPKGIWQGKGDSYLKMLNFDLEQYGKPAIIRPLGEANRLRNAYSAYTSQKVPRGSGYTTTDHRKAFRRIYIIIKGGDRKKLNQQLRNLHMPKIQVPVPEIMPRPNVRLMWSPLPNNQGIARNAPEYYWPGNRYVDIVGTSFFSAWPFWNDLNNFYNRFGPNKEFAIAEWGLNYDAPKFTANIINWCKSKKRCRSMSFYRGFGDSFELKNFPQSAEVIRNILKDKNLLEYYPEWLSGK